MISNLKSRRKFGYDILINNYESTLRDYIIEKIFLPNYGNEWKTYIPQGVFDCLTESKELVSFDDLTIDEFFEELYFLHLKDILIFKSNFAEAKSFLGKVNKNKFINLMDDLNILRRKIAHVKSTFSELDLLTLIDFVLILSQGETAKDFRKYVNNKEYYNAGEIPEDFYEEYECLNNLPYEEYDLDGGFVGREKEVKTIIKMIFSEQDRIISITGAGGVGKTAIAQKIAYSILARIDNPFVAILWFSAKTTKLTDKGIIPLEPGITSEEQIINEMLQILEPKILEGLEPKILEGLEPKILEGLEPKKITKQEKREHLVSLLSENKCLIIIDNLESIFEDVDLISLIKGILRPSQVLITSRKGIGEIENRYPIEDMLEKDAKVLFRIVSKERNRLDLVKLKDETITSLVKRVKCYPLLIKWSIGQVCLGRDIHLAFSEIFEGKSEIAKFSFDDVFNLFSDDSKKCLYCMVVYGGRPISRYALMHLSELEDDNFQESIEELIISSFVYMITKETEVGVSHEFSMLSLTRGFISRKFDEEETKLKTELKARYFHLAKEIEEFEKSKTIYFESLYSLGISTLEQQIAFNYVKAAKNFAVKEDNETAEENFEKALKVAPNFPYVLTEYAKFQFSRGFFHQALSLAKKSVEMDPDIFHTWMSYGILLRRSNNFIEAKECLLKAKSLNPDYQSILNELGRTYTFMGEFAKAESEFDYILTKRIYKHNHQKMLTLIFRAENYRRWGEAYGVKANTQLQIDYIIKALKTIKEATKIRPMDRRTRAQYRNICKDLGLALTKKKEFSQSKKYFLEAIKVFKIKDKKLLPGIEILEQIHFYLAIFGLEDPETSRKEVEQNLLKGLSVSKKGSKYHNKLKELENELFGEKSISERYFGFIRHYNIEEKYGFIYVGNTSYFFHKSKFRERLLPEVLIDLKGKEVSFSTEMGSRGDDIATDIVIENSK